MAYFAACWPVSSRPWAGGAAASGAATITGACGPSPASTDLAIRVVQLGSERQPDEGLRLGTVRRPPRGVRKEDYARRDYYDTWLPELAPTQKLLSWGLAAPWTPARWRTFARRYRAEMKAPERQHLLAMLAKLSHELDFSVGCYCDDAHTCHRSVLRELLAEAGARLK